MNSEFIPYQIFENMILDLYNSDAIVQFQIWKTHEKNTLLSKWHIGISVKKYQVLKFYL